MPLEVHSDRRVRLIAYSRRVDGKFVADRIAVGVVKLGVDSVRVSPEAREIVQGIDIYQDQVGTFTGFEGTCQMSDVHGIGTH